MSRTPRPVTKAKQGKRREQQKSPRRRRHDHAMAKAGWDENGRRDESVAEKARDIEQQLRRRERNSSQWAGLFVLVALLVAITQLAGALSTKGRGSAAAAAAATTVLLVLWWKLRKALGSKVWSAGVIGVLTVAVFAAIGAWNQTVTESGVALQGSLADRLLDESAMLESDLQRLAYWDELAGLDTAVAQARLEEIGNARVYAQQLAGDANETWASEQLAQAAQYIRQAALLADSALEARYNLVAQYDDRLVAQLQVGREQLTEQSLAAKQLIDAERARANQL